MQVPFFIKPLNPPPASRGTWSSGTLSLPKLKVLEPSAAQPHLRV